MEDNEKRVELQAKDVDVRNAMEGKEIKETEETIIAASKFRF